MQTRGHRILPRSKLAPHPRSQPCAEPAPESDPLEALCLVPLYLVVIAWIIKALGWWHL